MSEQIASRLRDAAATRQDVHGLVAVLPALLVVAANEIDAQALETRAAKLDTYVACLPVGVSTEADAEATNLRRAARELRG